MTDGSLIDAVWESRAPEGAAGEVRILPDGCVDLLWHEGRLAVAGPDRTARMARVTSGARSYGVRFLPGSARAVFGVPGEMLAHGPIPAAELLGAPEAERIGAALAAAAPAARPELLRRWAEQSLASSPSRDPMVAHVADLLTVDPTLRIGELAARVGYSERQLRRRVQTEVGYGPKLLARILRLQRTLAIARGDRTLTLADIAFVGGYVDQAHLGHECSALGGASAAELLHR
ncbi:MAG: AraC family transcriptional regulator [Solirubrobacteraceae bacterium]|nr:AraC family transcriptional regulator [Solirubrobacteraceae bacterium]